MAAIEHALPAHERIDPEAARDALAAALLHDLGHGPYSHLFEAVLPASPPHEAWTERFILEGPFNDISSWRFDRLGELFGPLHGFHAATEEAFEEALQSALKHRDGPSVINVILRPDDTSPALRRLSDRLRSRVTGSA